MMYRVPATRRVGVGEFLGSHTSGKSPVGKWVPHSQPAPAGYYPRIIHLGSLWGNCPIERIPKDCQWLLSLVLFPKRKLTMPSLGSPSESRDDPRRGDNMSGFRKMARTKKATERESTLHHSAISGD